MSSLEEETSDGLGVRRIHDDAPLSLVSPRGFEFVHTVYTVRCSELVITRTKKKRCPCFIAQRHQPTAVGWLLSVDRDNVLLLHLGA